MQGLTFFDDMCTGSVQV